MILSLLKLERTKKKKKKKKKNAILKKQFELAYFSFFLTHLQLKR